MKIDLFKSKILLVRNDNIGDLICTTPSIEALRKKYPSAQIDIVVNSYNFEAINNNKFVDKIYCYTKPKHKKGFLEKLKAGIGKLKILIDIKKEKYDAVIVLRSDYSKSAELFSKITNAKYKVGVKNKRGKDDFNLYVDFDGNMNEVDFCYSCLDFFGVKKDYEKTTFYIPSNMINSHLKYYGYSAFHISARMKNNQMSFNKLVDIVNSLPSDKFIITAEPKDYKIAKMISKMCNIEFKKTTSFLDLGALFCNLKLLVTLEGGAMHLAPAVGLKTIALFGVSPLERWFPWGYKELVIQDKSLIAENIDKNLIISKIKENIDD
ncbi:glycosyltransferase family 9 protein [Malaciobacter sp. WC5094]